jgi:lipooligosaccharide transport system permease protein
MTAIDVSTDSSPQSLRHFERAAFFGVWARDFTLFKRLWASTTFSAIVEPTVSLVAFGLGFGALVSTVNGVPYIEFVGTGAVATAVLFSSVFSGMYNTFINRVFNHVYDGILATPVDVHELVMGEATWIAVKSGVYGCAPLFVAMMFGLTPSWGMLAIPFIGMLTGLGFALMGQWMSAVATSIDSFNYVQSALITPLFLLAGTFFPINGLPPWMQVLAEINPLYHCVQLVRHAAFGWEPVNDLGNMLYLAGFAVVMSVLAIRRLRDRLID